MYKKAERPAGAPTVADALDDTPSVDELVEALGHMVAAARKADQRGNDIVYNIQHKAINRALDQLEWRNSLP